MVKNLKTSAVALLVLSVLSCSDPDPRPTGPEGTWGWVETVGAGIAGPYRQTPESEGYSLRYEFTGGTMLRVYKADAVTEEFQYAFIDSPDETKRQLVLTNPSGDSIAFLWDIQETSLGRLLYLRNVKPCCDNTFQETWVRLSGPRNQDPLSCVAYY